MTQAQTDITAPNLHLQTIELGETGNFSPLFLDYLSAKADLKDFYNQPPTMAGVADQISQKEGFDADIRADLVSALREQYASIAPGEAVNANMAALADGKTFTITTGHQLNIFTGPLYFIYKIATVVNACRELAKQHPDYRFVPVYWMASEDHDFEEIASFQLFGQKYTWETTQTGPVGRMKTSGLEKILEALPEPAPIFEKAYREQANLADAVRYYVDQLFGQYGVVVIDGDHALLKKHLAAVMHDDVRKHKANALVEAQSARLDEMGYKTQVFPREINFFWLQDGLRERIVREGNSYQALNTDKAWTEEELHALIDEHPEQLSPNVILRPLFQEIILPNLAYSGGPAEVIYWLQLKPVFDHYGVPFPVVMPRNFGLYINKGNYRKLEKTGVALADLFLDFDQLRKKFVSEETENELSLAAETAAIEAIFVQIKEKALAVDKTLEGWVGAESTKATKVIENIEKRLKKAEENKHATALRQLESLQERLFPNGSLQERSDNFLNFFLNNPAFIEQLISVFEPFSFRFHVLIEQD